MTSRELLQATNEGVAEKAGGRGVGEAGPLLETLAEEAMEHSVPHSYL